MNGLFLLDKPAGMTSFGVVRLVRKIGGFGKVGHTGTLDPFATGVLPVCVGRATRLASLLTLEDKTYEATIRLGITTDTMDPEGEIQEEVPLPAGLDEERIGQALRLFEGTIRQVPPMYSAVKVKGKALYKYAREGVDVERKPRDVTIYRLELLKVELPDVSIRVRCSKGTYVRVLASDIGKSLEVGGHLVALRRTEVGPFSIADAMTLEAFRSLAESKGLAQRLLPPQQMLPEIPIVELDRNLAAKVLHGNTIRVFDLDAQIEGGAFPQKVQLCHAGELLAIGELGGDPDVPEGGPLIQPRIVIAENRD